MSKTEDEQLNFTKKIGTKLIKNEERNINWIRNCPKCDKEIIYTDKWYYNDSIKKNRKCTKCKDKRKNIVKLFGKDNPNYKGKMDQKYYYRNCPNCDIGIKYKSYETYRKAVARNYGCGCVTKTSWASYNPTACKIFDEINKEMNWNGQHALNGGERKVLKYWVDYYEPTLNLVIEYDENWHKYTTEYDELRQKEIKNHLHCKFYRVKEGQNWREVIDETVYV